MSPYVRLLVGRLVGLSQFPKRVGKVHLNGLSDYFCIIKGLASIT